MGGGGGGGGRGDSSEIERERITCVYLYHVNCLLHDHTAFTLYVLQTLKFHVHAIYVVQVNL